MNQTLLSRAVAAIYPAPPPAPSAADVSESFTGRCNEAWLGVDAWGNPIRRCTTWRGLSACWNCGLQPLGGRRIHYFENRPWTAADDKIARSADVLVFPPYAELMPSDTIPNGSWMRPHAPSVQRLIAKLTGKKA